MIRTSRSVEVHTWVSTVEPGVQTEDESLADALEWADANPVAFHIVTEKRSVVFGRDSSEYAGLHRDGADPGSVLRRIDHLRLETLREGIFGWRARFTMEHYLRHRGSSDRRIRGDLFRLWDGQYYRSALHLDYTGETIESVLDQFTAWCDPFYKKVEVHVGDRVGRRFGMEVVEAADRAPRGPRVRAKDGGAVGSIVPGSAASGCVRVKWDVASEPHDARTVDLEEVAVEPDRTEVAPAIVEPVEEVDPLS